MAEMPVLTLTKMVEKKKDLFAGKRSSKELLNNLSVCVNSGDRAYTKMFCIILA